MTKTPNADGIDKANSSTYFIADLHLAKDSPERTEAFLSFCAALAKEKACLYIMGDLFDAWLGDDAATEWEDKIIAAINSISASGGKTYFQRGNRDFLIDAEFAAKSGCEILPEEKTLNLAGRKTLLVHGDSLCVDDEVFMHRRRELMYGEGRKMLLSLSVAERIEKVRELTAESSEHKAQLAREKISIPQEVFQKLFAEHDLDLIIHGHLHRHRNETLELQGKARQLVCLKDWFECACFACLAPGKDAQLQLMSLPFAQAGNLAAAEPLTQ